MQGLQSCQVVPVMGIANLVARLLSPPDFGTWWEWLLYPGVGAAFQRRLVSELPVWSCAISATSNWAMNSVSRLLIGLPVLPVSGFISSLWGSSFRAPEDAYGSDRQSTTRLLFWRWQVRYSYAQKGTCALKLIYV